MRGLSLALALALLAGCAAGSAMAPSFSNQPPPKAAELPRLNAELAAAREAFDEGVSEVTAGDADACRDLCLHRRQICGIAARICAVAERHPEHAKAAGSCSAAQETCADVRQRTPEACGCKDDGA